MSVSIAIVGTIESSNGSIETSSRQVETSSRQPAPVHNRTWRQVICQQLSQTLGGVTSLCIVGLPFVILFKPEKVTIVVVVLLGAVLGVLSAAGACYFDKQSDRYAAHDSQIIALLPRAAPNGSGTSPEASAGEAPAGQANEDLTHEDEVHADHAHKDQTHEDEVHEDQPHKDGVNDQSDQATQESREAAGHQNNGMLVTPDRPTGPADPNTSSMFRQGWKNLAELDSPESSEPPETPTPLHGDHSDVDGHSDVAL